MNTFSLQKHFIEKLTAVYPADEAVAITRIVFENENSGIEGPDITEESTFNNYNDILQRLLVKEPVQYVMQSAWFCDLKLKVTPAVLIPRPETEELVHMIHKQSQQRNGRILDIGTGSGCIALALKKFFPNATITGIDISEEALTIARENAGSLRTAVNFHHLDIFNYTAHTDFIDAYDLFDVIVSNPPYISLAEKNNIDINVQQYEPNLALFVDEKDDLIFYRHIADFARVFMKESGKLYLEIHQQRMNEVITLLESKGFRSIKGHKDISGNNRFIEAQIGRAE
jgi:release factor glutamine methyltransferase